jgi:hypothetical protein
MTGRANLHFCLVFFCALETAVHEAAEHKAMNLVTEKGGAYWLSRNVGNQLLTYGVRYPKTAKTPPPELSNWG